MAKSVFLFFSIRRACEETPKRDERTFVYAKKMAAIAARAKRAMEKEVEEAEAQRSL